MSDDPFRYIAPTATTAPKHAAIRAACDQCASEMFSAVESRSYARVNEVCRQAYHAIQAHAPAGADRSASERCVRLARMLANEAIATGDGTLVRDALDQLRLARMQACAAVALHDWE